MHLREARGPGRVAPERLGSLVQSLKQLLGVADEIVAAHVRTAEAMRSQRDPGDSSDNDELAQIQVKADKARRALELLDDKLRTNGAPSQKSTSRF